MYIKEEVSNTLIIEKSRFIAYLKPCFSEQEYKDLLKEIRKHHHDANHVCSAFISDMIKRSSDDGEPSGTAGVPILSVLEKNNINHTACYVVRYFGGIKLGAGGLIRAYGQSCSDALNIAKLVEDVEYNEYSLVLTYELANKVNHVLEKETFNLNREYGENVKYTYLSNDDKLIEKIAEITSGIKPIYIGNKTVQKDIIKSWIYYR